MWDPAQRTCRYPFYVNFLVSMVTRQFFQADMSVIDFYSFAVLESSQLISQSVTSSGYLSVHLSLSYPFTRAEAAQ